MSNRTDTNLPPAIEQILTKLAENSKTELDIVRALADGIRRVDDQMLREVRTVALQHEVRREAIFGELQELATRLCAMPNRSVLTMARQREYAATAAALENQTHAHHHHAEPRAPNGGGDWRMAAQKIDDELNEIFNSDAARH